MANCSGKAVIATRWHDLCEQAHIYMCASAWESVEQTLLAPIQSVWDAEEWPAEAIRAGAQLATCWKRLGKLDALEQALTRLEHMLETVNDIDAEGRAMALLCLSSRVREIECPERARAMIHLTEALPSEELTAYTQCRRELQHATVGIRSGELDLAECKAIAARRLAHESRSEGQLGDCFFLLATIARRRGRMRDAKALCGAAAGHYARAGDEGAIALVALSRGIVLSVLGEFRDALQSFAEGYDRCLLLNRRATAVRTKIAEGYARVRSGELHLARVILLRAWRRARMLKLPREEIIALEFLAQLYVAAGQIRRGERSVRLARRLVLKADDTVETRVGVDIQEAGVCIGKGDYGKAASLCKGASEAARAAGLLWDEASALHVWGVACIRDGRRSSARKHFLHAEKLFGRMSERFDREIVTAWLTGLEAKSPKAALANVRSMAARVSEGQESVLFWIDHPMWGPTAWFSSRVDTVRSRESRDVEENSRNETQHSMYDTAPLNGDRGTSIQWKNVGLVTRSARVREVLSTAETFAAGRLPILILGETGTGKDLLAKGIHDLSGRRGNYVPVNCAAASRELFAAELFGARKGAYTGATDTREGLAKQAAHGTLFLDEIADLDIDAQGYLLRFLDSGEVRAVGAVHSETVDARVVAATCRDLSEMVGERRFRTDLLNRLSGLRLWMPALRNRLEDLELLIEALWKREGGLPGAWVSVFSSNVVGQLCRLPWTGNVRELRYAVARAIEISRLGGESAARRDLKQHISRVASSWQG